VTHLSLLVLAPGILTGAAVGDHARQWEPIDWQFENSSWDGNPFDLIAEAVFEHVDGGETIRTELFYARKSSWVLRFTGPRPGTWKFTTRSKDADLDGLSGEVTVEPNPGAVGFMTAFGNKWGWLGVNEAFVPQIVSYCSPPDYHNQPGKIDRDIKTWFEDHGFNGLHTFVGMAWFDLGRAREGYSRIKSDDPNPDPRTFEALELLIGKVHRAGGMVHIWTWGDEQREMTPARWGLNGAVDQRLQRYICARLGPLPGWSMGYGFDLQEWAGRKDLDRWHRYMHAHLGWFHFLGARAPDLEQIHEGLDYLSYQQHRPTYDTYVEAIEKRWPGQAVRPAFLEDRFRVRRDERYADKDYTEEMTRRGLWHSTMAGGAANIWAYLIDPPADGSSRPYPNKVPIRTYSRFWKGRFHKEMVRSNARTDGVCLEVPGRCCVFYKEQTDSIRMDLGGMPEALEAVAVDTQAAYQEIPVRGLKPTGGQIFQAAHRSDWAVAVRGRTIGK